MQAKRQRTTRNRNSMQSVKWYRHTIFGPDIQIYTYILCQEMQRPQFLPRLELFPDPRYERDDTELRKQRAPKTFLAAIIALDLV